MKVALVLTSILVAACSSNNNTTQKMDAAGSGSGSNIANTVTTVSCTGATVASTVTTDDTTMKYTISNASITAGSVVHFTTSVTHDVNPSPESTNPVVHSDPGIKVGFSGDACLKFSTAGAFTFYCSRHGFTGTITVN
jgi:plastocyanin